jgi:hypothetical protein
LIYQDYIRSISDVKGLLIMDHRACSTLRIVVLIPSWV